MSIINSSLKTWLRRNGFKAEYKSSRGMRGCNGCLVRNGRRFRIRGDVVDIGELVDTFDRWANSIERTIPLTDFLKEFKK